ncbi:MAG: hypothetical protein QXW01_03710 [Candidatus Aenigmatarchaeota archaeon]
MACECRKQQEQAKLDQVLKQEITLNVVETRFDVFEIAIPINIKGDTSLKKGKYRFYFNIRALNPSQLYFLLNNFGGEQDKEFKVLGKRIIYRRGYADKQLNYFIAEIELLENPIPLNAVVYGLLIIIGTIGALLTLEKVEKIIEVSKPFALAITIIAVIVLINVLGISK